MFLQQLINGTAIGSTYALVAIGYSLIFGVLRIINFANGSLYMMGAYITLLVYLAMRGFLGIAFLISLLVSGVVGFSIDFIGLRKLRRDNAPRMSNVISTLGMAIIIDNIIQIWFGTASRPFPSFLNFGKFYLGNVVISWTQVIIFAISITIMAVFSLVVYRTKIGKSMRAVSQNIITARLMGINVKLVISATFVVSGVMAAVSGTLVGAYYQIVDTGHGLLGGHENFCRAGA